MHIEEIHGIHLKRAEANHQTYKTLFLACCEGIRQRATLHRKGELRYIVPPFVWGRPVFQREHATRYVVEKLRHNGFDVSETEPSVLLVKWDSPTPKTRTKLKLKPKPKPKPKLHAHQHLQYTSSSKQRAGEPDRSLSARLAALRKRLS